MRTNSRLLWLGWVILGGSLAYLRPLWAVERFEPPVGEAVQWLLEHNRDYQKALADRRKARLDVVETGAATLPSLQLSATGTHLGNIQDFKFDSLTLTTAADDNYSFNLGLTQLLFSGSAFQAIGVARSYERVAEASLAVQRAALLRGFLTGYSSIALLEELRVLNEEVVEGTKARLEDARLLHEIGALSRFDLLRSEVEHMNSIPALREAEDQLDQARAALVLQLALEPGTELGIRAFELACSALAAEFPGLLAEGSLPGGERERLVALAQRHRPERDLATNAVEGYRRAVRVYQSDHLPTLAAFANLEHANQWDMFSQEETWRSSWNVGLQASLPLFSGFRTAAQVAKGRQDLRKAQADESQLLDAIGLDVRTALDELQRRSLDMMAWERNAEAAAEGLEIAHTRRESGAGSELELRDARTAMKAARANAALARHQLLTARIDLLHALGLLDETFYLDSSK
jgi:outer membrane protein TolC